MKIGSAHRVRTVHGETAVNVPKKRETSTGDRKHGDEVIISDHAREQLAKLADEARATMKFDPVIEDVDEIRISKIRQARERLQSGYYNRPEILEDIAGRLADSLFDRPPDTNETPEQS